MPEGKIWQVVKRSSLLLLIILLDIACADKTLPNRQETLTPEVNSIITIQVKERPVETATINSLPVHPKVDYPKIANLWGIDNLTTDPKLYAGFDLFVPYTFPDPARQAELLHTLNPDILILNNQYATKGRPEFAPIFKEWWDSKPGEPGYICFLRDSKGTILLVKVWNHPMVNMTVLQCRQAMVKKNVDDFKASSFVNGSNQIYNGIYWDLIFGSISWLGPDIDSNLDGQPDNTDTLNKAYQDGVIDFLTQLRANLPDVILAGNEATLAYSKWMDGRLFEWQLSNILDGADYLTWDEVIAEYRTWTVNANSRQMTIIQSSPTQSFASKYPGSDLDKIPPEIMAEAQASYQRMRFGLTSALMGDGYYSFDFGPMIHGFPWWYDEYGAPVGSQGLTLPPHGYLGQPIGAPLLLDDNSGVWARAFDYGLAVINTTKNVKSVKLPNTYCKIKGDQAPLFETIVDADQAKSVGGWKKHDAGLDQFGKSVLVANANSSSTVTYTPSLAYSGTYEVFAWVSPTDNQSTSMLVSIHHANGNTDVQLDEKSGKLGWRSLGVFLFNDDSSGSIELHSNGQGISVADAIKLATTVRYNDGSKVDQITLQPQDGIVLVSCKP